MEELDKLLNTLLEHVNQYFPRPSRSWISAKNSINMPDGIKHMIIVQHNHNLLRPFNISIVLKDSLIKFYGGDTTGDLENKQEYQYTIDIAEPNIDCLTEVTIVIKTLILERIQIEIASHYDAIGILGDEISKIQNKEL